MCKDSKFYINQLEIVLGYLQEITLDVENTLNRDLHPGACDSARMAQFEFWAELGERFSEQFKLILTTAVLESDEEELDAIENIIAQYNDLWKKKDDELKEKINELKDKLLEELTSGEFDWGSVLGKDFN